MDELKAGQAIIQDLTAKLRVQMERAEKAEGERDKLRATLEQYATESSWIQSEADDVVGPFGDFDRWTTPGNGYDLAREALTS